MQGLAWNSAYTNRTNPKQMSIFFETTHPKTSNNESSINSNDFCVIALSKAKEFFGRAKKKGFVAPGTD